MRGKVAKKLRKMAVALTQEDAPFEAFEAKHQQQIVPPNWGEYQASLADEYTGPPVSGVVMYSTAGSVTLLFTSVTW